MSQIQMLLKEMDREAQITRKMLERIPDHQYGWKPHEKSMSVRQLATHIAELPSWISMVLTTDELDFANSPYQQKKINNTQELLAFFESSFADGKSQLEQASIMTWSRAGRLGMVKRFIVWKARRT